MKRFLLTGFASLALLVAQAQNLDDVSSKLNKQDYTGAKADIDKLLLDSKNANKADAWYFKGRAYNGLSRTAGISKEESLKLKTDAFDAFKKAQELDNKDLRLKMEGYASYLDLYLGMYDLGANFFNDKKYSDAHTAFKSALNIGDFINQKKYTYTEFNVPAFDTSLVINTGVAASQAGQDDVAMGYYRRLIDNDIQGANYRDIYVSVADYYRKKGDQATYDAVAAKGRQYYAKDAYWNEAELQTVRDMKNDSLLFLKYEDLIKKSPEDHTLQYNYGVELYNSLYGKDAPTITFSEAELARKAKTKDVLINSVKYDSGIESTVLLSNLTYNIAADYSSASIAIKGTKPDDVKKKAEYKKQMLAAIEESIPYHEKVIEHLKAKSELKGSEKGLGLVALDHLVEMYRLKGNAAKSAEYEKMKADFKS